MAGKSWIETTTILATLGGGLVLAGWTFLRNPRSRYFDPPTAPTSEADLPPPDRPSSPPRNLLIPALLLLGGGLAFHYLLASRYPRWALLTYLPLWGGIALLVAHTLTLRPPLR